MKRIQVIISVIILLLPLLTLLTLPAGAAAVGETITLSASVTEHHNIKSGSIEVIYDGSALELVSGDCLLSGVMLESFAASTGLGVFAYSQPATVSGGIFSVRFRIKTDNVQLTVTARITLVDANGTSVTENVIMGTVSSACEHKNTTQMPAVPSTLTDTGFTAGVFCNDCRTYISGHAIMPVIPGHVHTMKYHAEQAPTCTKEGNTAYYQCTACNICFSDSIGISIIDIRTTVIPVTAHILSHIPYKAATCSSEGNTDYRCCDSCGVCFSDAAGTTEITLASTVIPATAHEYGEWEYDTVSHWHECLRCKSRSIQTPHSFGEWQLTKAAAVDTDGTESRVCADCGMTELRAIPRQGGATGAIKDEKTGITIDSADGSNAALPEGTVIKADRITASIAERLGMDIYSRVMGNIAVTGKESKLLVLFDIALILDGNEIQPGGSIKVTVPLPDGLDEPSVIHIDNDGNVTRLVTSVNGDGTISFITGHLSYYAIVGTHQTGELAPSIWVFVSAAAVVAAGIIVTIVCANRRKRGQRRYTGA